MPSAGLTPDRFTHNALLEAHAAAGDLYGAARAYERMHAAGVHPDHCTFIPLFQARAASSNPLSLPLQRYISCRVTIYCNVTALLHQQHRGPWPLRKDS